MLLSVLLAVCVGSFLSMGGGVILLAKGRAFINHFSLYLTSFATGVMLATALLDLLPEAQELALETTPIFEMVLVGMILFFLLERYLLWFHHHEYSKPEHNHKPTIYLLIMSDILHNTIDGIAIAASFLANPTLGVATTIAVALHEIPKEMSNFSLLLTEGMSRRNALLVNIATAFASLIGALLTVALGSLVQPLLPLLLAFTGGMFLYIAGSDLLPSLNEKLKDKKAYKETAFVFVGILVVWYLKRLLE